MKMKTKKLLMLLATLASLVITVVLWFAVEASDPEFTKVTAVVKSSEKVTHRVGKSKVTSYEVTVSYDGKTYDLKNCHDSYSYVKGASVTAYLSNGKLYANTEGVKTSTPLAGLYFFFLFATFAMMIGFPVYLSKQKEKAQ